jgi:hypothetical protein
VIGGGAGNSFLELIAYLTMYQIGRGRELRKSFTEKPIAADAFYRYAHVAERKSAPRRYLCSLVTRRYECHII